MILATFDLQVTSIFPIKFRVNWHFPSGQEVLGHLEFLIKIILAIFDLQVTHILSTKFQVIGTLVQKEKFKTDCHDGGHLGFPINMILAIFDLRHPKTSKQVSSQLASPSKRSSI